jgi:ABC-2 type transport system ATP-binding protein
MADGELIIKTSGLTRRFGKTVAVDGVDLEVPRGCVFGLAGRNGAGKTTLIRMMLGLLDPTKGSAEVLGFNPRKQDVLLRQKVGYVPEEHHIYRWMKVREVLRFCAPFYPTWDEAHATELLTRFDLDPEKKIGALSKGMVAKVALTLALAHHPPLLVLDEPTSGLDVIVRREFLESIVRLISEEGKTVLMSSHLLDDVERVVDRLAFLDEGKLVLTEDMASLKARFRRVRIAFENPAPEPLDVPGICRMARDGRRLEITFDQYGPQTLSALRVACPAAQIAEENMNLEDIFVELVGRTELPGN